MTLEERSAERRKRIVGNVAHSFQEAEDWDLEFWQSQTPEARLSALVAIRRDIEMVLAARRAVGMPEDPDFWEGCP
jgi:hypothetical protein